jgi:EmrB/QacA subfamily drug resistance transporter
VAAAVPSPTPSSGFTPKELRTVVLTTIGVLMFAADSTIVILALPTMARQLAAPLGSIIWVILIYLLTTTVLTTQAGRLGDLFGRRGIYNAGFAVFTIGSALCGLAPSVDVLIAARFVQAVGGAVIFANGYAVVADAVAPARRGRAFGFFVSGWATGAILGILLGGAITTAFGWRYIFYINVPIGLVAIPMGLSTLPKTPRREAVLDFPGFLALSAALGLICYGAIEFASYGVSALNLAYVLVGLLLLPVFVAIELRARHPMIDFRQVRERYLGLSLTAGFLQPLGYLAVIFLLTMYLQGLRGLSPLDASLLLVPGYLIGAVLGPAVGRRVQTIGARRLTTLGISITAVAVLLYSTLTITSWIGFVPLISCMTGIGAGIFYPSNATAIMSRATPTTFGSISGLQGTLLNLGALLSFVLALSIASASVPRYVAYAVFLGTTNLGGPIGSQFLGGLHAALWGCVGVLALGALISWTRGEPTASVHPVPGGAPPAHPG